VTQPAPNTAETERNIRVAHVYGDAGADDLVVNEVSLGHLLELRSRQTPDKEFLRFFDDELNTSQRFSYADFNGAVARLASWLAFSHGVRPGDTIGILAYNHPHAAIALFACWRLGAIAAPQNLHETDARMAFALKDAGCKILLAMPVFFAKAVAVRDALPALADMLITELGDPGERTPQLAIPDNDFRLSPALIVYTSGTTGNPKGVVLTQYNLMVNALGTSMVHGVDAHTRMMCVLPIHHVNGILVTLVTPLIAGASVVLNRSFKPAKFWRRAADEGVAIVSVVPTLLQFLCEADEDISTLDLAHFRHIICGAGTLSIALVKRFESRFGIPVIHGYGLSETTAFVSSIPRQLPGKARQYWAFEHGYPSIGVAYPHVEMAIHDADGRPVTRGIRGEIVVRGHYIMAGYHHRADANAETFKHAWFRSGDEGFFEPDDDGCAFYFITGRLKELINRGGVKYSPFEIEEVLLMLGGVKAGLAIAFENDWYGEEVGAYVVRESGASIDESQILEHCRKHLPFAQSPKVVIFGDDIPVTTTGKYQRLKLKPLFEKYQSTQFRESTSGNINNQPS
jgi:acyl-CoA synthetase (AMP-forming)/AMP-acid ligase II